MTVLNTNTKRETGKKAQFANIQAAKVRDMFQLKHGATTVEVHAAYH